MLQVIIISVVGLCAALYAYVIGQRIKQDSSYKPACDINDWMSCSKPVKSSYANILPISYALLGVLYYLVVIVLALLGAQKLLLIATVAACVVSLLLAYLLYFKIKSLCVVCTFLYLVNVVLLVLTIRG